MMEASVSQPQQQVDLQQTVTSRSPARRRSARQQHVEVSEDFQPHDNRGEPWLEERRSLELLTKDELKYKSLPHLYEPRSGLLPDSPLHMQVTWVNDPHDFYATPVQHIDNYMERTLKQRMYDVLKTTDKNHHLTPEQLIKDTLVLAVYEGDGEFYRAYILKPDDDGRSALVYFVDFGNTAKLHYRMMYPLLDIQLAQQMPVVNLPMSLHLPTPISPAVRRAVYATFYEHVQEGARIYVVPTEAGGGEAVIPVLWVDKMGRSIAHLIQQDVEQQQAVTQPQSHNQPFVVVTSSNNQLTGKLAIDNLVGDDSDSDATMCGDHEDDVEMDGGWDGDPQPAAFDLQSVQQGV